MKYQQNKEQIYNKCFSIWLIIWVKINHKVNRIYKMELRIGNRTSKKNKKYK